MISFVKVIVFSFIFAIVFSIILSALNKSGLQLFVSIQKRTGELKRKKLYSDLTFIFLITLCAGVKAKYNFSDIVFGILLGLCFAIRDAIFGGFIGSDWRRGGKN